MRPFIGDTMKKVLCDLAQSLGEGPLVGRINKEFDNFVKQAGDTSRQLSKFLQQVIREEDKLCKVLKAINQSIIATPFLRLKQSFQKLPFEDIGGKWKIIVNIIPKEEVCVIHQKAAASKEGNSNLKIHF